MVQCQNSIDQLSEIILYESVKPQSFPGSVEGDRGGRDSTYWCKLRRVAIINEKYRSNLFFYGNGNIITHFKVK